MALVDIHVSSLLQILEWVVGSFYGIPTFRRRHSCNSESGRPAINAAEVVFVVAPFSSDRSPHGWWSSLLLRFHRIDRLTAACQTIGMEPIPASVVLLRMGTPVVERLFMRSLSSVQSSLARILLLRIGFHRIKAVQALSCTVFFFVGELDQSRSILKPLACRRGLLRTSSHRISSDQSRLILQG